MIRSRLLAAGAAVALLAVPAAVSAQDDCTDEIRRVTDALQAHYPEQASAAATALRGDPATAEMPRAGPDFELESEQSAAEAGVGGGTAEPTVAAEEVAELSEAQVEEVVALRQLAMASHAAGMPEDCLRAIGEAEALLFGRE